LKCGDSGSSLSEAFLNPNNRYQEMSGILRNEYLFVPSKEGSKTKQYYHPLQGRTTCGCSMCIRPKGEYLCRSFGA